MKDVSHRGLVRVSLAVTFALGIVPASADVPLLVTREWVRARLGDAQLRIVDMSTESARTCPWQRSTDLSPTL